MGSVLDLIPLKGLWFINLSLSSSYLFVLKFHHLYLTVGIIGRWNKRHNTVVLQHNTFTCFDERGIDYVDFSCITDASTWKLIHCTSEG